MTKRVATNAKPQTGVDIAAPSAQRLANRASNDDAFRYLGGSRDPAFNLLILNEVAGCAFASPNSGGKLDDDTVRAISSALAAFEPTDEIEGMLAAQAVALHFGAMECLRRAMIPSQPADIAGKLRKEGANLARSMADMLAALDRKRGKGHQVVRVERVVVHEGGQAIVGNVAPANSRGAACI